MMRLKTAAGCLWIVVGLLLYSIPIFTDTEGQVSQFAQLSEKQKQQLGKGKVVLFMEDDADGNTWVRAVVLFQSSLDRAWKVLLKTEDQKKYLDNLEEVRIVSGDENRNCVYFLIKWLFINIEFQLIQYFDESEHYLHWHLDSGFDNDLEEETGYWRLSAYNDSMTIGEYSNNMALKGLPGWLENIIKKSLIKNTLKDLKKYIDSRGD